MYVILVWIITTIQSNSLNTFDKIREHVTLDDIFFIMFFKITNRTEYWGAENAADKIKPHFINIKTRIILFYVELLLYVLKTNISFFYFFINEYMSST